jgi:hypothetical protein
VPSAGSEQPSHRLRYENSAKIKADSGDLNRQNNHHTDYGMKTVASP